MLVRADIRILIGAAFLLLVACTGGETRDPAVLKGGEQAATPPEQSLDSLALERSSCSDACRAYRLVVARSGMVRYESYGGADSGKVERDSITPDAYEELLGRATFVEIFALPAVIERDASFCGRRSLHGSYATIYLYSPSGVKRVEDYLGCAWGPAALRDFERTLDSTLNIQKFRPAYRRPIG